MRLNREILLRTARALIALKPSKTFTILSASGRSFRRRQRLEHGRTHGDSKASGGNAKKGGPKSRLPR